MKALKIALLLIVALTTALADARERLDHSDLSFYRDDAGVLQRVEDRAGWERRRRQILRGMEEAMGALPKRSDLPPLDVEELDRHDGDGFSRATITFTSGDGDRVPAHLYRPSRPQGGGPLPAIVALHPTSSLGKGVVAGKGPRPNRNYAVELAQRGYVVIAPDYPSFGHLRDYDFDSDRYASGTLKGIFNHMRCVDLLQSLDVVDSDRLGAIGHSLGGHNAMFVGVFDERLKAIVSSCGWTPFHDYYGGRIDGWTSARYMPRLRDVYELDPDRVPFDFYEVVAALAPRAFFSSSPLRDHNFDVVGVMKAIPRAARIYELYDHPQRLQVRYPNSGHDFPPRVRRQAYAFLDRELGFKPVREVPALADEAIGPAAAATAVVDPLDTAHFSGPWDLAVLSHPPGVTWGRRDGLIREVFYESEPWRGKPTRVFAYYGAPAGDGPFPAMLLVHGGGGTAFREWAELWARRGYVALAMDTAGHGPGRKRLTDGGPRQDDAAKFQKFDRADARAMWTYHAVAGVVRGHSLLAAQKEVDPSRIGITGISWGGYLTCIVSGIDPRLKVAVPVYGCGFLDEDSAWLDRFSKMGKESRELWVSYFDPSRYLAGVRCPILFVNGTNDFAYPLGSYQKSYDMVPGAVDLSVQVRLPHGHPQGWSPIEIGIFVDSVLDDKPGLAQLEGIRLSESREKAMAIYKSDVAVRSAHIHFTHDRGKWQKRKWQSTEARLEAIGVADPAQRGTVVAAVPEERPLVFYLAVTDERGAQASTRHVVLD